MASQPTVRGYLEQVIGTGQLIGIIYNGGSQPGSYREIAPLEIKGDKVRARCYTSNAVKEFLLDKIELRGPVPTPEDKKIEWDPNRSSTRFDNVEEVYRGCLSELATLGWTVEFERYGDSDAIWLRSKFKSGNLRKSPDISLQFEKLTWDEVVQPDGSFARENIGPRQRPWIVRSNTFDAAKSYSDSGAAVAAFLDQARQQALPGWINEP